MTRIGPCVLSGTGLHQLPGDVLSDSRAAAWRWVFTKKRSLSLSLSSRQYPTVGRQLIYQNQLLSFLFPVKSFVIWTGRAVRTNRILKGRNRKCRYDISSRLDTQYTGKGQEPSNVNCIIRRGWKDWNWVASPTNYRHTAASHATRINKRWGEKKKRWIQREYSVPFVTRAKIYN